MENNPNTKAPVFRSITPTKVRVTFPIEKTTQQKVETITFTRDIELPK